MNAARPKLSLPAPAVEIPIRRAPSRLTAVARNALPRKVRPKKSQSATISAIEATKMKIVCPVIESAPAAKRASQKLGLRKPSAPKKTSPRPGEREMDADRDDQQHEHGGVGEALVRQAVDERAEQRHDRERQRALHEQVELERRRPPRQRGDEHRRAERAHERLGDRRGRQAAARRIDDVEQRRHCREAEQQPDRPRHPAELEQRERQRAEGDELALRDEDDARDREDEDDRERQQRIDGAVGDAVEQQDAGDRSVHAGALGSAAWTDRRLQWTTCQSPFTTLSRTPVSGV